MYFVVYNQQALVNTSDNLNDVVTCDCVEGCVIDCLECGGGIWDDFYF